MKLCETLVEVHAACIESKQHETELRAQVLEHSDDSDVEMGKYTITFVLDTTCRKFDMGKLKYELNERFGLNEGKISEFIESVIVEKNKVRHIAIKQTVNMKPKPLLQLVAQQLVLVLPLLIITTAPRKKLWYSGFRIIQLSLLVLVLP